MKVTHLLVTSVYCQPLKPAPLPQVMTRWEALGDSKIATAAICEAEILFGIRKKNSTKLAASYEKLLKGRFDVLPVDSLVAAAYAELRADCEARGTPVADMDLLIAANGGDGIRNPAMLPRAALFESLALG